MARHGKYAARANFLLNLFADVCRGTELGSGQTADLDLIRDSVAAGGASCARMTEVIWCFQHGPAEERSSATPGHR
jgi:hypothetical protein